MRPPARRRAGAPVRDRARAPERPLGRERRRDRRARPARRRRPRDGVDPTYKPSVYVGRVDPKKLEPLSTRTRRTSELPGLQPRDRRRLPARLDLEAGHRARGDAGARLLGRTSRSSARRRATYGLDEQVFVNWNPYVNRADDAARGARGVLRHVLLRRSATASTTAAPTSRDAHAAVGAQVRLRRADRARHRRRGGRPRADARSGARRPSRATGIAPGTRATRSSSRSARRTCSSRRCRWRASTRCSRTAASVVTPYLVSRRRAARSEGLAARRAAALRARRRRSSAGVDPDGARGGPRRPLRGDALGATARRPASSRTSRSPIAGKTGTAEKVVQLPGYPRGHLEDQSWWCGWGPSDVARIVVCAVIENGGHGSTAAAPAALKVFERFFGVEAPRVRPSWRPTDGRDAP